MNTMRESLRRRTARLGPGAGDLLDWWGRSLAALLPARWRALLGLSRERLLLRADGDELQLDWQRAAECQPLARLPLPLEPAELESVLDRRAAELPRWLLLPAASVLRRGLLLPAAAAERLRDVAGFEIDRQTPFTAEAVRFDARIVQRRADGQIEAELAVVPRERFDAALAALGGLAGTLSGVDAADAEGAPLGVNLLPPAERSARAAPQRRWQWLLAAIALLATAGAMWQLLDNRRAAADALAAAIEDKAPEARRAAARQQLLVSLIEGTAALDKARAARPTSVEVLAEATRRLPDGTWLEKLSIEGERLTLIGLSPEASALVGRLEGSPLWRSPALSGALQPDPGTRMDRFTLTAELVAPPAAPRPQRGDADGASRD
ncbi:PilN domain-containing protein [Pseudoxanthomonas mexicana]|uniref:PilN domain-containing protein n=1 Tax=Pseudoxanthomonas mexicana TaxID=128785 RepID=UPI00398AB687